MGDELGSDDNETRRRTWYFPCGGAAYATKGIVSYVSAWTMHGSADNRSLGNERAVNAFPADTAPPPPPIRLISAPKGIGKNLA